MEYRIRTSPHKAHKGVSDSGKPPFFPIPSTPCAPCAGNAVRQDAIPQARAYLAITPGAIEGQNGDFATFRVACDLVHGFALDHDQALSLIIEWNVSCRPPWNIPDLERKITNAGKYRPRKRPGNLVQKAASNSRVLWKLSEQPLASIPTTDERLPPPGVDNSPAKESTETVDEITDRLLRIHGQSISREEAILLAEIAVTECGKIANARTSKNPLRSCTSTTNISHE